MVSPNSIFTELVTTTLREHPAMLFDNVSKNNALLNRLFQKKQKVVVDGGTSIVEPIEYAENSTYQRYSGYDTLNIGVSDVLSAAEYQWKNVAVNVTASGDEIRKNSGKNAIINLVQSRIKVAMKTFNNNFSNDIYSDGTEVNQINGLAALVADAGTGTVGGIDSSVYTFWKNAVQSAATPLDGGSAVTPSASTIEQLMLGLYLAITRGSDTPDLIVAGNTYYQYYEQSLTELKRYTSSDDAKGGFISLKYKMADVIFDSGTLGGGMSANKMYFLNTDYLKLKVQKDAQLTQMDDKVSVNQDAVVIPLLFMGNLTLSNRSLQGVLKS
jgi:hypothetical protein